MKKITVSGGREFEIRDLTVKDVKSARRHSEDELEQEIYMIAAACGLKTADIEELPMEDYGALKKRVFSFLETSGNRCPEI